MQLDSAIQTEDTAHLTEAPLRDGLPRWRRHLRVWLALGVAVLLMLLVPPLINGNRYQRQIARSMSLSLGRPVHLDNVSLHLLPVPGLTLSNLVVSEDPAFGSEPTIRANTVEATLRLGSLWRRRVEFSTVRFVEPSVNLVRNAQGRWNLADVLLHASHVTTAPTVQRRAGPAPRFPYIEATGGRVNLKLDEEKLPYALTDADFALWQPSPHQWRVRLRGQPDRTDANLTEPGILRIEGDLFQATAQQNVHVNLRGNWHDAPLGQASLLLLGNDFGWRGSLNLEASLTGTLDAAHLAGKLTLGGLRRAEFAAAHPLDLQISCGAGLSIETVSLRQLACTLPDNAPQPMTLTSPELNLQHPGQAALALNAPEIPSRWAILWAGLFSPRIPTEADPGGTLSVQLAHRAPEQSMPASLDAPANVRREISEKGPGTAIAGPSAWSGLLQVDLPSPSPSPEQPDASQDAAQSRASQPVSLVFHSVFEGLSAARTAAGTDVLRLQPVTVHPDAASSLLLAGNLSLEGYTFSAEGLADRDALLAPARFLPQLGDGMDTVMPVLHSGQTTGKVDLTCSAVWGGAQLCTEPRPVPTKGKSSLAAGRVAARAH